MEVIQTVRIHGIHMHHQQKMGFSRNLNPQKYNVFQNTVTTIHFTTSDTNQAITEPHLGVFH